jgi:uncharacterized membrane protein YgcG
VKILTPGIVSCLLFFAIPTANAQTVKGILVDESDNSHIAGATVKLINWSDSLHKDSSTAYTTISNKNGVFIFTKVIPKLYHLSVESVGLGKYQVAVSVKDSMVTDLASISISKTSKILNEVVITANAPQVKQKADTLEYSASQFKVNPDANVEDLIKKMPGVTVDKAGAVTAQGEQVKKVTVDGKDFFGDDATAALRNLPAEIIDKIQVFDKLSDQAAFTGFDDGNSQKSINVVTKVNMRNGQFGRMYAGYGTDSRYNAGGNVSFFKGNRRLSFVGLFNNINQQNFSSQDLLGVTSSGGGGNRGGGNRGGGGAGGNRGGGGGNFGGGNFGGQQNFLVGQQNGISKTNAIGINYSNQFGKKLTLTGSYFFNNTNNANYQITNSATTLRADSALYYRDTTNSASNNYNNRVNLRLEYKIDSSNSLSISPSLSFQKNNSSSLTSASQAYDDLFSKSKLINRSTSSYSAVTSGYNFNNTVLFRHAFVKKGRTISLGVNTSINHKLADSYTRSNTKSYKNGVTSKDSTTDRFVDYLTNGNTNSVNLAYTEPVGKKGQLQINYNPSFTTNKADQQTYLFDPIGKNYSVFNTQLSNKFNNTYNTQNAGVTYRIGDRDNQFSAGVSFQNSNLKSEQVFPKTLTVNKSFTNVLPNLQLRKKLSAKTSINIFFRTSVNSPSVTQLQNVENTNNPLNISTGNPDLKQQYTSSLVTRFTFTNTLKGQSFFANIFVQQANNYVTNATFFNNRKDSILESGYRLDTGVVLTKPINLSGYLNIRSFLTYGAPLKFIRSNINLNAGVTYSKLPGATNYIKYLKDNYVYNAGAVLSSNISQYIDFNLSYNTSYNIITQQPTNQLISSSAGIQFNLLTKKGQFLQNDLNNQSYRYQNGTPNVNFWLWNLAIGQKFLKDQKGELKLSVFDLLKQNKSVTRTVSGNYVEDVQSQVLQRYFMLTFTYKLKNFGTPAARAENNRQREDRGF